jgi:hypothetical protein
MTKAIPPVPDGNRSDKGPGSAPKVATTTPKATVTTKSAISTSRPRTAT